MRKTPEHLFDWKYLGVSRKICIPADDFYTKFDPVGLEISDILNLGKKNL